MKKKNKVPQRFCCPHCLSVMPKSPDILMLAEGADEVLRGAYHLDVIERAEHLHCRKCQGRLVVKRLIAGDYDYNEWVNDGPILAGLALFAALRWGVALGWASSIGIALVFTLVLWLVASRSQKQRIRARVLKS